MPVVVPLTTREIALTFWTVALIGYAIWRATDRAKIGRSMLSVVEIALSWPLILPFGVGALYIVAVATGLGALGFWSASFGKEVGFWFILTAVPLISRAIQARGKRIEWGGVVQNQVRVVVGVEYVVSTFTFHLAVEMVLVPLVMFAAVATAFAERDESLGEVRKAADWVLFVAGTWMLAGAAYVAASSASSIMLQEALKVLVLVPTMTTLLVPYLLLVRLYGVYDELWRRADYGRDKGAATVRYLRRRALLYVGLRASRFQHFVGAPFGAMLLAKTRADVDALFESIQEGRDKLIGGQGRGQAVG